MLTTEGPGYRLHLGLARIDLRDFTTHRTRARELADRDDLAGAVVELRAALALWDGPALAGLDSDSSSTGEVR